MKISLLVHFSLVEQVFLFEQVSLFEQVFLLVFLGHGISVMTKIKRLDLKIKGKSGDMESLNIVAVSDIHLGTLVGKRKMGFRLLSI